VKFLIGFVKKIENRKSMIIFLFCKIKKQNMKRRTLQKISLGVFFLIFSNLNVLAQYSGGDGTSTNPYQISNLNDLEILSNTSTDWNKHFIQTINIDASTSSSWNGGNGFSPIGNGSTNFTGVYDGLGYAISNLFINRPSQNEVGFFGRIGNGEVKNLGVVAVNISGSDNVGGLAGFSQGIISNCYTSGEITGYIYVGGFIGNNSSNSFIQTSYSIANVNGTYTSGGFVGILLGTIENSYSRGNVVGDEDLGGFAGQLGGFGNPTQITNVYSTGIVTANFGVGGFVGWINSFTASNCFWDITSSGHSNPNSYNTSIPGVTGLTTTNMKIEGNFTDWDFVGETINGTDDIWTINVCINDGYPSFTWQGAPVQNYEILYCEGYVAFDLVDEVTVFSGNLTFYDDNDNPLTTTLIDPSNYGPGSYNFSYNIVDGNSCETASGAIILTITGNPTGSSQTFCEGVTVNDLIANGNNLQWYDNAVGGVALSPSELLISQNYYVTASNNACETDRTAIFVTVNNIPNAPSGDANQSFCSGALLSEVIVSGINILWYDASTGGNVVLISSALVNNNSYFASQTVNGCESSNRLAVTTAINEVADISTTLSANIITANNANATYQWVDCDDNNTPISGATNQSFTATANGNYAVELTENGCLAMSVCVEVNSVGINNSIASNLLSIFPNPTKEFLNIETNEVSQIKVLTILGEIVMVTQLNAGNNTIDVSSYPSGVYFIQVTNEDGSVNQTKFIKE